MNNLVTTTDQVIPQPYHISSLIRHGLTWTVNSDYSVRVTGTNTVSTGEIFNLFNYETSDVSKLFYFPAGTYTFSCVNLPKSCYLRARKDSYYGTDLLLNSNTFTLSEPTIIFIGLGVWGTSFSNFKPNIDFTFYPMINSGTIAKPYCQYKHIVSSTQSLITDTDQLIRQPYYDKSKTENGVTITVNNDYSITIDGTSTATTYFKLNTDFNLFNASVILDANTFSATNNGYTLSVNECKVGLKVFYNSNNNILSINIFGGYSFDNFTIYPMINIGTAAKPYVPYKHLLSAKKYLIIDTDQLISQPYHDKSKELNGITWIVNSDYSITANGTATSNSSFFIALWSSVSFLSGSYYITGCPISGSYTTYRINYAFKDNDNVKFKDDGDIGNGFLINATNGISSFYGNIVIFKGYTANNLTFYPMLNVGNAAKPYAQYRRIVCE